jgi:dTMP kinase
MTGPFITFEGPEGSGKSTHIRLLTERLRACGLKVVITREPGGTPLCEAIRNLLQHDAAGESPATRAEALLFCASRAQLVQTVIRPAMTRGAWVLSDRFADSTFAYQGFGRGIALADLQAVNTFATDGLAPDLTLLLDLNETDGHRRLSERRTRGAGTDRFEREPLAFHARLREGFLKLASAEPERFLVIPTGRDMTEVAADVWQAVATRFAHQMGTT